MPEATAFFYFLFEKCGLVSCYRRKWHTNALLRVGVGPVKRLGVAVVQSDVIHNLVGQIRHGVKNAAADAVPGDQAQPDFHLIQPGVGRREMELNLGVPGRPSFHCRGLMSREVVEDHMDGLASMLGHGFLQKLEEGFAGVARRAATEDFPAMHLQGSKQRDGSVSHILDRVSFRAPRSERQGGLRTVQRLNRGLFVDAENRRIFRSVQIQTQNIFGLGLPKLGYRIIVPVETSETRVAGKALERVERDAKSARMLVLENAK